MKNTEVVLLTPGQLEIQRTSVSELKEDEVLIKVGYVGVCGSDIHGFMHGPFIPPKDPKQKICLGHECAGTIVRVGAKVKKFQIGERVVVEPGVPCGRCKFCLSGHYNLCVDMDFLATSPNYRGALTNYLIHKESFTYKLPETISMIEGAVIEPAAVGMHAAMEANIKPGKKVVILGAGCIGLMTLQACRMMGATEIVVCDVIGKRLAMAKKLGAMEVIHGKEEDILSRSKELLGKWGADIVFETAGNQVTASQTTKLVARGGKILIVGTLSQEVAIDFLSINREVKIQTVFRYANNFHMTIEAIASGRIDVKSMITDIYTYKEVQRAFEEAVSRKAEIIKSVIKIEDEEGDTDVSEY